MNTPRSGLLIFASICWAMWNDGSLCAVAEPPIKISPLERERLVRQLSQKPIESKYKSLLEFESRFFKKDGQGLPALVAAYNRFGTVHVEFTSAQARAAFENEKVAGTFVFSRIDRFADMFVESVEALAGLERHQAVRWIDRGDLTKVPNPRLITREPGNPGDDPARAVPAVPRKATEDVIRAGDRRIGGLTGKGAIIVIIDTGIDFRNPDFIRFQGNVPTSRILYYWDTLIYLNPKFTFGAEAPPVTAPNGTSLGIVYTQDGLTKDLRDRSRTVPLYDIQGHGTSCAGVAAGNANNAFNNPAAKEFANECLGAAGEADLIVVRIAWLNQIEYSFLLGTIIDWVEQKSQTDERMKGRPIVYSCSWGSDGGDRAGNSVLERQLDARFPLNKPGRSICIAAGNEGDAVMHGRPFLDQGKQKLVWESKPIRGQNSEETQFLRIYFSAGDKSDLQVDYVPPENVTGKFREELREQFLQSFQRYTFRHGILQTLVTEMAVNLPPGRHELHFTAKNGAPGPEDAYVRHWADARLAEFTGKSRAYGKQIGFPAAANNAICVGSYDWNTRHFNEQKQLVDAPIVVGALSSYSNPGPSRSGQPVKPDIVAPGQYWTVSEANPALLIAQRKYRSFNGTSAATPYVAGVVALMMQKKPNITVGEVKQLLQAQATRDADKLLPKDRREGWGNGKLDADAVQRIIQAVK